jgi:hypothetical protein
MIAGLLVFLLVLGIMPAGMLAPAYAIRDRKSVV